MNRGKTANMFIEDYDVEVDEYLVERELERENVAIIESFRRFISHEEVLYID